MLIQVTETHIATIPTHGIPAERRINKRKVRLTRAAFRFTFSHFDV
jgi:hypothetical protein